MNRREAFLFPIILAILPGWTHGSTNLLAPWILATHLWNDSGQWVDLAVWID